MPPIQESTDGKPGATSGASSRDLREQDGIGASANTNVRSDSEVVTPSQTDGDSGGMSKTDRIEEMTREAKRKLQKKSRKREKRKMEALSRYVDR